MKPGNLGEIYFDASAKAESRIVRAEEDLRSGALVRIHAGSHSASYPRPGTGGHLLGVVANHPDGLWPRGYAVRVVTRGQVFAQWKGKAKKVLPGMKVRVCADLATTDRRGALTDEPANVGAYGLAVCELSDFADAAPKRRDDHGRDIAGPSSITVEDLTDGVALVTLA